MTTDNTPLIYRVIGQMRLGSEETEEAFSEGLVALAEAEKTFQPERGVPQANWLAQYIRWSLATWITKERQRQGQTLPMPVEVARRVESGRDEFNALMAQMAVILTEEERFVTLALAWGYKGKEVAKCLGRSQTYVSNVKHRARYKLQQLRQ